MKTASLYSLLFLSLLLLSVPAHAVTIYPPRLPEYPSVLMAEKNGRIRYYQKGEPIRVEFNNGKAKEKIKGFLTRISADSVEISSFGNGATSERVAISSLISITKLKRKERKTILIIAGALGLVIGILAIASKGPLFGSAWAFAIIGIPAIATGYFLVLYFGLTYLLEWLNKSSVKRGWKFYAGNHKPLPKGSLFRLFSK